MNSKDSINFTLRTLKSKEIVNTITNLTLDKCGIRFPSNNVEDEAVASLERFLNQSGIGYQVYDNSWQNQDVVVKNMEMKRLQAKIAEEEGIFNFLEDEFDNMVGILAQYSDETGGTRG